MLTELADQLGLFKAGVSGKKILVSSYFHFLKATKKEQSVSWKKVNYVVNTMDQSVEYWCYLIR